MTALHGIVMASFPDPVEVQLLALDPATGAVVATRTFNPGSAASLAISMLDSGPVWRSTFNADLTEAAATGPQQSDGSSTAGYVDASGNYTPLTSTPTGYSSALAKTGVGFAPDGEFWYMVPSSAGQPSTFGTVNPGVGPSSDAVYNGPTPYATYASGAEEAYVTPSGLPLDVLGAQTMLYLPGGTEVAQGIGCPGYEIARWDQINYNMPCAPLDGPADAGTFMVAAVSATSFITTDSGRTNLWLNVITNGSVHISAILPVTNQTVSSAVVSPDGQDIAFLTGGNALWVVPVTGGTPQQLTQFAGLGTQFGGLMTWLP